MLVLERVAPASELVSQLPELDERAAVFCRPTDSAVVLGSTQPESDLDPLALERAGLSLTRRRSGGGAVLVGPGRQLWLDVYLPLHDARFERDVTRAPEVIGEAWREALIASGLGGEELSLHRGGLVESAFSRQFCFLGLGPGEVCWSGQKVLGLSQRRDRRGAWFFTMALFDLAPEAEAALFADQAGRGGQLAAAIRGGVRTLPRVEDLETHLVEALERQ